jgi:glycosyltransferase involved in cell wall biosynthesis
MRISVYITSYNQKHWLIEAIESVLAQTYPASQIIVVDDFSSDGSQEVIAGYVSRYPGLVTAAYHSQNFGVARTRIDALHKVTGEFVTYVDGDDRFLPTKLEREAELLDENANVPLAFSNNYYISAAGIRKQVWADGEKPPQGNVFSQTFGRRFPRKSLFRMELVNYPAWARIGFHDPNLTLYEDFDMRIRLTKNYPVVYCDAPLSEIRVHNTGLSEAPPIEHLEAVKYIYRKNKHLLRDLDASASRDVRCGLGRWMAGFARKAAERALRNCWRSPSNLPRALSYRRLEMKYRHGYIDS